MNEDEVEFLDSILERTRAEEDRVKKETQEGLALFRQQQEEADKKARRGSNGPAVEESAAAEEEPWAAGRKRKRAKEKEGLKGVKARRSSTLTEISKPLQASPKTPATPDKATTKKTVNETKKAVTPPVAAEPEPQSKDAVAEKKPAAQSKGGLGLVDYGSDEDDW